MDEDLKYTPISDNLFDYIKKHCSDAMWMVENNTPIWRGDYRIDVSGPSFVDPSKSQRTSNNTLNFYTLIFDNIPSMASFPKRSRSLIGSVFKSRAREYASAGDPYAIIPFNGVKIGCVQSSDMWDTEIDLFGDVFEIVDLNHIWREIGLSDTDWAEWQRFDKALAAKQPDAIWLFKRFFRVAPPSNFLEMINHAYSPEDTGFKLYTTKTLAPAQGEVWVGGPCVFIPEQDWKLLK